ncbi:MAG: UbiA family prenyltransferase [FCB group bacterium]|nr:UbiA family prenyltransferase [FCB group bacterium]
MQLKVLAAYGALLRPLNLLTGAFAVWVSAQLVARPVPLSVMSLTLAVVLCFNAGANALNDYWDVDIDRINRPERPLSRGLVSRRGARGTGILLLLLGSLAAVNLPPVAIWLSLGLALPLMVLYTPLFKGRPLIGNVVIAFILGLTFLFSGAAFQQLDVVTIPAALAFGLTLVRELVKDMADVTGDRKVGVKTYPVVAGLTRAGRLAAGLSGLVGLGALGPLAGDVYGWGYGLVVIPGVCLPLVYILIRLLQKPTIPEAVQAARILKFSTIAGVLAIYLGAVY